MHFCTGAANAREARARKRMTEVIGVRPNMGKNRLGGIIKIVLEMVESKGIAFFGTGGSCSFYFLVGFELLLKCRRKSFQIFFVANTR